MWGTAGYNLRNFSKQRLDVDLEILRSLAIARSLDHVISRLKFENRATPKIHMAIFVYINFAHISWKCESSDHFSFGPSRIFRKLKPSESQSATDQIGDRMSLSDKATYLLRYLPRFNLHNVEKSPFTKKVSFEAPFREEFNLLQFKSQILTWSSTLSTCSTHRSPMSNPFRQQPKLIKGRYANWKPKRDMPKFRLQTQYLPVGFNFGETSFHKRFPIENCYKDIKSVCRSICA